MPNNAINTDGLVQRASGALPKPAGYGERYVSRIGSRAPEGHTLDRPAIPGAVATAS